jgi:penicillin-binding protein 1C
LKAFLHRYLERLKRLKLRWKIVWTTAAILFIWYLFCLPSPLFHTSYSTVVTAENGELLGVRLADDGQWRFPPEDSIPLKYKQCLIEFEDRYFRQHWGINPISMFRAVKQNISSGRVVSGGSTITMQTVRMARNRKRTVWEKCIESILATRLEFACSKDEIINLYATHAPMGGNVAGITAASWRYFGHAPSQLSWAEAATLAVLPNSPALLHFDRNRDLLLSKRNRLLKTLIDRKVIDSIEYDLALSEPLPAAPRQFPQTAPHLVDRFCRQQRGKYLQTTIQYPLQVQTEQTLNRWYAEFSQMGINNLCAVVFDINANKVIAYCGNVNYLRNQGGNKVDIIQSPRSTGSILKPILYAAMLEDGNLLPRQLIADIPVTLNGYSPRNFSQEFDGAVPASQALARSLNIPFVLLLRKYGVQRFYTLLQQLSITSLTRSADNYGLSLILGGAEASLWEVATVYLHMAQTLINYTSGEKDDDKQPPQLLLNSKEKMRGVPIKAVISPGAVWQTFEALTDVNRPEEIDWHQIPSMQKIAWKTGTSFGYRDAWAIGINARYLVAVWAGNADGEGSAQLVGAHTAGRVMFDLFNLLPDNGGRWFKIPEEKMKKALICHNSGLLKGMYCPEAEIDTVPVCPKGLNGEPCKYHRIAHLSADQIYQVYENCSADVVSVPWFVLPPSWEAYYRQKHNDYKTLPPFAPDCADAVSQPEMVFIYPPAGASISLAQQLDGSKGTVVFELAVRNPQSTVFWHMDGQYISSTSQFHRLAYSPQAGAHQLTAVDETGKTVSTSFTVK